MQAFFIAESVGIFDVVENLFDKGACVEIVRGDSEQVAFGGVVEAEYVRVSLVAGQNAVAVVADFVEKSRHFVVHADPAVAIGGNVLGEFLELFLDKIAGVNFDGKSRNFSSCDFLVVPRACVFVVGKGDDFESRFDKACQAVLGPGTVMVGRKIADFLESFLQ